MSRNGHRHPNLRVLLSGAAANGVAATLEQEPTIKVLGIADLERQPSADVVVHVLDETSGHQVGEAARRLREVVDAPLILAVHGEANGIVETGLAVGAADVLVLPQPAETLLFAIRKAANGSAPTDFGKVITVFSPKGGSGKTVAGDEPRGGRRALGRVDPARRPRPAVRRLRADARSHAQGDHRRPRGLRR